MTEQTIFRAHRTERDKWTPLLNETIRDKDLSFRATGLLVFLLSLPPDWKANQQHIASCKTEGRDAVITAWNELRKYGYIEKEILREKGQIVGTIWNVYETRRNPEKPEAVEPEAAGPFPAIPTLQRTKKNKKQKEQNSADAETVSLSFGEFWVAYPRKTAKEVARKAFAKAGIFDSIEEILAAIPKHKLTRQWIDGFIPHPATWLNQKRWKDDLSHEANRSTNTKGSRNDAANAKRVNQYAGIGRV